MKIDLNEVRIRTDLSLGDLGYIAYLHGRIYENECNYGFSFEYYVLKGLADLSAQYDPNKDCVWICEHKGTIIGSVAGLYREECFQLRFFILLPQYRGLGLGKKLLSLFLSFMKEKNYKKSFLWTTDEQREACSLYQRFGFRLTEEKHSKTFGKPLTEQRYDLNLPI
jgi:GNAT superfamily N-acetyltransferase